MIAINDVGVILEGQGKFQEAKPWYAEVLETNRRVNGKDHASTIIAAANMGNLLEQGGDLSGAVPFYLEALNAVRRTKGAGHPWGRKVMTQPVKFLGDQGGTSAASAIALVGQRSW